MNFNQVLKGSSLALVASILASVSFNANAMGSEWTDNTTCYLLKQGKLISKSNCSYKAARASSVYYNYMGYNFKLPNSNAKLNAERSVSAKKDGNGNYITDRTESLIFDTSNTLNDKPAVVHYRYGSSLKVVPKNVAATYDPSAPKGVLNCMQEKSSPAWEICAPAEDVRFGGY